MKIEATKYSPMVELSDDGQMIIKGRSILEDPLAFFDKIIGWIKNNATKKFTLEIHLEYMNTSSSKLLLKLLKAVKDKYNANEVYITWYYETNDEDMYDLAKDFETLICIPIDFVEVDEEA